MCGVVCVPGHHVFDGHAGVGVEPGDRLPELGLGGVGVDPVHGLGDVVSHLLRRTVHILVELEVVAVRYQVSLNTNDRHS